MADQGRLELKSRIIRELEAEIERLRAELRELRNKYFTSYEK